MQEKNNNLSSYFKTNNKITTIAENISDDQLNGFTQGLEEENELVSLDSILGESSPIITWGLQGIDENFGATTKGKYEIFYGNAGSGKTTFLFQRAIANAKNGIKTCFVSLEMSKKDLLTQYALKAAGIKINSVGDKIDPTDQQKQIIKDFLDEASLISIKSFKSNPTMGQYKELLEGLAEEGYQLLIIDNLGMIGRQGGMDEMRLFPLISETTRVVCNSKGVNVVLVHHSKKASEGGNGQRGTSAFRGTAKLLDDVDIMVQIMRTFDDLGESSTSLLLEKDRVGGGAGKSHNLLFDKGKFSSDIF